MAGRQGEERRRAIVAQARAAGHVDVATVAGQMSVAVETIRRDLQALEDQGLLRRTHGGAYPIETGTFEVSAQVRAESGVAERRRIGAAAVQQFGSADTVFLDEGPTARVIVESLTLTERPLTIVTTSVANASVLADRSAHRVLLVGGRVRSADLATVDHWAVTMLHGINVDLAVLTANGISPEHGLTVSDPAVAAVKEAAVAASRRRIFVGVHQKFGVVGFCKFADVADFELLISDTGLPGRDAQRYQLLGPRVLRA